MQAMTAGPDPKRRIETLYQSALEIRPSERPSFLDEMCGQDSALRQQVESLLSEHETIGSSVPSAGATRTLSEKAEPLVGQYINHYKILSMLGRGGMGEVYLAYDTKLARKVALKLLPRSLSADEDRLKRFSREARSASALNHPNVCVIYEIGETSDGRHFIAIEHIEGTTLRDRLRAGPLTIAEAIKIAEQVAAALAAAHTAGVVHRDIKPENIMVRPDGYVKVLDFGLAKLTEKFSVGSDSEAATVPEFRTLSDRVLGTVNYLSPEQARRLPVDERTDIWSLGVVLYEMLSGHMPFSGETVGHAMVAILEREPEPLANSVGSVPVTLERIVRKALSKQLDERYPAVTDFVTDLETLKLEMASGSFKTVSRPRQLLPWSVSRVAAAVLVVLIAVAVIYLLTIRPRPQPAAAPDSIQSVAVLPFVNAGNDPNVDYLSDGITETLINDLSQLPKLKVIGRNSAFRYKGRQTDTQTVARELGVEAILTGRIIERDGNISVYVDLEDARDKHHIWGGQFNRKAADLLAMQEEISQKITEQLRVKLNGQDEQRLAKRYTQNVEAYQLYLKGRWYWNKFTKEGKSQAEKSFQQAIVLDPNYALAYAGLADVYVIDSTVPLRESYQKSKNAAEKALTLDKSLGEAHATLGLIKSHYDMDWSGAEAEFKKAIELNPNYATAHHYYGDMFLARGNFDRALEEFEKARQLDPLSPLINTDIGQAYFYQRDYDRCIEYSKKSSQRFPDFFPSNLNLAWAYTQKKMYKEALAEYDQSLKMSKGHTMVQATLAYTYAVSGKKAEAQRVLKELTKRAATENISPVRFALIHAGLGQKEQALQYLERAREDLDVFLIYIRVNPFFDSLRNDPKFQDLVQKMGLASH